MSEFNAKHNRVVWMDIPVADLDRAVAFYKGVLAIEVTRESVDGFEFAILAHDKGNGGCLVPMPDHVGAKPGPHVYLNTDGRIRDALAKTAVLGGEITQDVHPIGPHGFRAFITDSEGNTFVLHSYTDA